MPFQPLRQSPISSILFVSLLFCLGCDDEVKEPTPPDNHIIIEGEKYKINDVILTKGTPQDLLYKDGEAKNTHYYYQLNLSDGEISTGPVAKNASYLISVVICVPLEGHTEVLPSQQFNALPPQDFFGGKILATQSFFSVFFIRIDTNGNSEFDINQNDKFMDASIGTITSTRSGDNYTFIFANTINDPDPATPVTGRYEGTVRTEY